MTLAEIQYVADEDGNTVAAIVPIGLWREIESEKETACLLKSAQDEAAAFRSKESPRGNQL